MSGRTAKHVCVHIHVHAYVHGYVHYMSSRPIKLLAALDVFEDFPHRVRLMPRGHVGTCRRIEETANVASKIRYLSIHIQATADPQDYFWYRGSIEVFDFLGYSRTGAVRRGKSDHEIGDLADACPFPGITIPP